MPEHERPYTSWLARGHSWYCVGRLGGPRATVSRIGFWSADGELLDEARLDPSDLVPFDAEVYQRIPNSGYALHTGPGQRMVGAGLRRWTDARYDSATGRLLLQTYRPTSPPFHEDGELRCHAQPTWIAIPITDAA